MTRAARLLAGAPIVLLLAWKIAPLAAGSQTLFLRDVLNSHLALRAYLGDALRRGEMPLVDPLRAGGQALAGNANALPFYPDNLLLLVGSDLWALNAHFWLHWLLALAAAYALGRVWGSSRAGAWMTAIAYGFSGWMLSQMNLYNGVAGAALAPALVAAAIASGSAGSSRRAAAAFGAVWALLLLGGDPILAALALPAALALAGARHGRRLPWGALVLAFGLGTAVAAPQLVELSHVLPASYRGFQGYDAAGPGGWKTDPRAAIELAVPVFFGRIDTHSFWGRALFGGFPPLHAALHPGWIALALAVAGTLGAVRRGGRGAIAVAALGLAGLALTFSPRALGTLVAMVPGADLFRFPSKFFLWAALALALAGGTVVDSLDEIGGRRRLSRALIAAFGLCTALALFLLVVRGAPWRGFLELFAPDLEAAKQELERARWLRGCVLSLVGLGVAIAIARRSGRSAAAAALAALLAASQFVLLAPLLATDEAAPYQSTPSVVLDLPASAVVAHGSQVDLFGRGYLEDFILPDGRARWLFRQGHRDALNYPLLAAGRRTELNISPEGLDVFTVHALAVGMKQLDDARRLTVLEATGVDRLLLARDLDAGVADRAPLVRAAGAGEQVRVYALPRAIGDAQVLGSVAFAPTVNHALAVVSAPDFDPRTVTVVAGTGAPRELPPGRATVERFEAETIEVDADSPAGGFLVVRRAWLPIWGVEIDGRPAKPVIANLTRLAVELPAGRHRVRFFVDRTPLSFACAAAAAGALGLALLAFAGRRRPLRPGEVPASVSATPC